MQTDQDLIARLREGDPSPALSELFRRHGRMVERTVLRQVRDEHLAQDVCQAVFWILLRKAGSLKGTGEIGGWLHRTATLVARNALRVEARRRSFAGSSASLRNGFTTETPRPQRRSALRSLCLCGDSVRHFFEIASVAAPAPFASSRACFS